MKCESCTKYDDCRTGSGLTWPCGAYRPKAGSGTDIEKLVEDLRIACAGNQHNIMGVAATTLSTLQAENEKLRAELERVAACVYYKPGGLCRYDGDDPANVCVLGPCDHETTAKEVINELEQARESLDFARTKDAEIVRLGTELEQVKRERDAAVSWAQKYTESIDRPCVACKHNTGDYVCTAICGNCGPMGTESCKWEFDFSGELKED